MSPHFIRFILGETDSEILFFIILSEVMKYGLNKNSIAKAINKILEIIGPFEINTDADDSHTFLSFILTNGKHMAAFQGGKSLYYSSHKTKCPESGTCNFYNDTCEKKVSNKTIVNHLLFSSEPLSGQNEWTKMKPGEFVMVDSEMEFSINKII